ncbi:MAG: hypothetical protein KKC46_13710 [Proteobacteria bacterium]|nr:hypothetical protein [Pseudomonadota bacterium]
MRLCNSIPGKEGFDMEDLNSWGLYNIKKLIELMNETLAEKPFINDSIGPKGKERLEWICFCLDDKIEEIEECFIRYLNYVNDLEDKLKVLENKNKAVLE